MKQHRGRLDVFYISTRAVLRLLQEERSVRTRVIGFIVAVVAAVLFRVPIMQIELIILAAGIALAVEALNSAVEDLCDHVTPEYHDSIKRIKDTGAAASLFIGFCALLLAAVIFAPAVAALLP